VFIGGMTVKSVIDRTFFGSSIAYDVEKHPAMEELAHDFHGAVEMGFHAFTTIPFLLALAGVVCAYVFYMVLPGIPATLARVFAPIMTILENKYYFDWFNENVIAPAARAIGRGLWKGGDAGLIDTVIINGSARSVGAFAGVVRLVQNGYIYWYALVMVLGVVGLLTWQLWPYLSIVVQH